MKASLAAGISPLLATAWVTLAAPAVCSGQPVAQPTPTQAPVPREEQDELTVLPAHGRFESRPQLEAFLRQRLAQLPLFKEMISPFLPAPLERVIAANQPQSGDFLLSLAIQPQSELHRQAVGAFVVCWQTMSAEQITAYLSGTIVLQATLRPQYPEGFDVYARFSYSVRHEGSLPAYSNVAPYRLTLKTRTTHFVDGQPWEEPYEYQGPGATTGWLRTGKLALGEHYAALKMEFEWEYKGLKGAGKIESERFAFRIVNAALPDDLSAIQSPDAAQLVKTSLQVSEPPQNALQAEKAAPAKGTDLPKGIDVLDGADPWQPQLTGHDELGKPYGLHGPDWNVERALPFALTFDVEIHDVATGEVFKGDPVFVPAGKPSGGYFMLNDAQAFAAGRTGLVPVKIVLLPSYALAMSEPAIKSFFAGQLVYENFHVKVVHPAKERVKAGARE